MLAIPIVFLGITVSPFGRIGHWLAFSLFIIANLLLWSAMVAGFFINVYRPWRDRGTRDPDDAVTPHDGDVSGEPSDAPESASRAF